MQITRAGVTVQPLAFQFGVVLLSGGESTGGSSGTSGSSGGSGDNGSVGGFIPAVVGILLGFATLGGIIASTPPPSTPPAVAAGPVISAPPAGGPPAAEPVPGAGTQQARSTPAPIVLAASAAQTKPIPAATPSTKGPGLVLPYTGANLWIPLAAGTGLIGLGVWLRRFAEGLKQS